MKVVILGAGGSFGINVALHLLDSPARPVVVGVGRSPLRSEPFSLGIEGHPRYRYKALHLTYELDLLLEFLDSERPDIIINFAAQGESATSWKHSWRYFETNSMGLARLVEELLPRLQSEHGGYLRHFIQIGTSELYGSVARAVTEEAPVHPTSPYATSKLAFDFYLMSMAKVKGFPTTILRPSNAYGPGQLLHRVIPRAIWSGVTGRKFPLQGGTARKSYIYIDDLARAIERVIAQGPQVGQVYNLGPLEPTSITEVVAFCAKALEMKFDDLVEHAPPRPGEDACYWLDSSKADRLLDWRPVWTWEEGLEQMVLWARRYHPQIKDLDPNYIFRG